MVARERLLNPQACASCTLSEAREVGAVTVAPLGAWEAQVTLLLRGRNRSGEAAETIRTEHSCATWPELEAAALEWVWQWIEANRPGVQHDPQKVYRAIDSQGYSRGYGGVFV